MAHAQAQPVSNFSIDLNDVSKLYDTLYRDRITDAIADSTVVYDWRTIPFGNQRARVPTFLPTDADTTRRVVDYRVVPGFRTVLTLPRTAFFEEDMREVGELMVPTPRDFTIPGLRAELSANEDLVEEILRTSRAELWRESTRANITAFVVTPGTGSGGGITFEIPVPMPKSLESIFGPGEKTSITIRGREEITIAGETRVVNPYIGVEGRENQSYFPSLDMEQKLDVSLIGTIGDKVAIQVDHSSEAIGDDANRVRLAYTGYEDEVIQLIELGNTSLSLPGSQLVSVSTNAQGLFGVKMLAKMGSTDVTVIASKQEGEATSAQFSPTGGTLGQTEVRTIRDVDYVKNKYFYINNPLFAPDPDLLANVSGFEVYRTVTQLDDPTTPRAPGWAIPDPADDGSGIEVGAALIIAGSPATDIVREEFELLQRGFDYEFIVDAVTNDAVGIELFEPIQEERTLAVRYTTRNGTRIGGTLADYPGGGGPGSADLVLEQIKPPRKARETDPTWPFMFRNIYNLGLTNIDDTSLEITIEDTFNPRLNPEVPEGATVPYLRIFGLDQTDRTGTGAPDGRVDLSSGLVNLTTGLLQFPDARAFAPHPARVAAWTDSAFSFTGPYLDQYEKSSAIYDTVLSGNLEPDIHRYVIRVSAVSTSRSFRINAIDIVENSETVTLDGKKLVRGTDYTIDYDTGEVQLRESASALLRPDSKVNIDYEYKPLGGIGSSTLAGFSTTSKLGENARLGTTLLYESKAVSADRPRLGEEPTRAIVGGVTGGYQHQSRILTDVANWLPYVDSDAPSTIQIDGEIAGSLPNPNTRNEAYIDDFEGVEDSDRIPMTRRSWYPATPPVGKTWVDGLRVDQFWYNIEPERGLHRRDLNPNLDRQENTLVPTLDLELVSTPTPADSNRYAGIMLGFAGGGLDLTQAQFIEFWVNDFKPVEMQRGGTLRIDMGLIDENFIEPDSPLFHDEDKNRDGFAAAFDDTGLDGLFDAEEPNLTGDPDDPSGDNHDPRKINGRYLKVNGTEGNRIYDTEDLDRNGQLSRENAYFSFTVNLADTAAIDIRRQYPGYRAEGPGHELDAWRLYRLRISDYTIVSPTGLQPRFDEIRHMRIWFDGAADVVRADSTGARRIQIAEFSIEGNRWEADGVRFLDDQPADSTTTEFALGVISTKTDPGVYHPPVNPNTVNDVSEKESSLVLRYSELPRPPRSESSSASRGRG